MEFTKEIRRKIISEFVKSHGGKYNPAEFVEHVAEVGPKHPAYGWFVWDDDKAAAEYRLWQARMFTHGIKITFSVETVGRGGKISVRESQAPFLFSPQSDRSGGESGYVILQKSDSQMMAEYCREAGAALWAWIKRYELAALHVGIRLEGMRAFAAQLEDTLKTDAKKRADG